MRKISLPMTRALERLEAREKLVYTYTPRRAVGFMVLPRIHLGTYKALLRRAWIIENAYFEGCTGGVSKISGIGRKKLQEVNIANGATETATIA